ncbi:hypothetical protein OZD66_05060, partial [Wolbachia endosymbiont of Drosophila baimaii]|uniref:hypothetical protein n=1 Tax=Wolbachia endosymbiont of Drosophila baimaii TaxID=375917 RepID=UPI0023A95437
MPYVFLPSFLFFCSYLLHQSSPALLLISTANNIAFLIIVRTGHRKAESTARRKDSNRGMF